jgi:hypothetical protein
MRFLLLLIGSLLLLSVVLFVHNSGYGYDALEYLVIGRALRDGQPFYTFVPSKSWALYALLACYLSIPQTDTHLGISLLVAAVLITICLATYVVVRRTFGCRTAFASSMLVGASSLFMELNYVEPEGFVYLCGLMSFAVATRTEREESRAKWLGAGLWIGVGMAFKSVAGFYLFALVLWTFVCRRELHQRSFEQATFVIIGFLFAVGVQLVYFGVSGRLQPYMEWSFIFPVFYYPASTEWFAKLYTKLLWVWVGIAAAAVVSFGRMNRRLIYNDDKVWLLLAFGAFGLVPLLKVQASHYAFPGAAFFLVYVAVVFDRCIALRFAGRECFALSIGGGAFGVCLFSAVLYQPTAFLRLIDINSYADERPLRIALQEIVRPGEYAIFFDQGTRLYWISERYPNWPLLNTDVQTTYFVERNTPNLLHAFDDPRLTLVEFDPRRLSFDDRDFLTRSASRSFLKMLHCKLEAGFTRRDDLVRSLVLWTRRMDGGRAQLLVECP